MSEEPKRPPLKLVTPDTEPVQPPSAVIPAHAPSQEAIAFSQKAKSVNARVPFKAAYLASAGAYLADAALDFHHQAASHAPTGTFRHDVPPGLKSAQATRTWLGTHLNALREMAKPGDKPAYARSEELKKAAQLAGDELDRATQPRSSGSTM
jgi:hypothetical protein